MEINVIVYTLELVFQAFLVTCELILKHTDIPRSSTYASFYRKQGK